MMNSEQDYYLDRVATQVLQRMQSIDFSNRKKQSVFSVDILSLCVVTCQRREGRNCCCILLVIQYAAAGGVDHA